MSRIENRPDPNADAVRGKPGDPRGGGSQPDGNAGAPFRRRLAGEPAPEPAPPSPAVGSEELPVLVRPLPEGEALGLARPRVPEGESVPSAGASQLAAAAEGGLSPALELDPLATPRAPRRGPAAAGGELPGSEGAQALIAPLPVTPPTPVAATPHLVRGVDPALLQQVVDFAAVTRNSDGLRELVVGTNRNVLGGSTLRLIALGGGRIALRYRPGTDVSAAREGISSLARSMRERGVNLVDVEEESTRS